MPSRNPPARLGNAAILSHYISLEASVCEACANSLDLCGCCINIHSDILNMWKLVNYCQFCVGF